MSDLAIESPSGVSHQRPGGIAGRVARCYHPPVNLVPGRARAMLAIALGLWLVGAERAPAVPAPAGARALAGRLLVASADMRDPRFAETVIYMVRHDPSGAMGLVVNRPLRPVPVAQLLERFGMASEHARGALLVHWGGPVDSTRAFVLHTPDYRVDGTIVVKEQVAFTGNRKIIEAIAANAGPRRRLFAVGYAGWAAGQLEAELERGGWLTAAPDEDLLFDDDHASKWRRATARRILDL
jgi:putative transcriptional regulator